MESPLLTCVVITFGVLFCFCQQNVGGQSLPLMPNHPNNADGGIVRTPNPQPPPPSPPRPSPPPPSPPPPSRPPPRSSSYSPLPPSSPHLPHHPPPLQRKGPPLAPPSPKNDASARNHNNDHGPTSARGKLSPPAAKEKRLNFGKKIGLLFVGIAALLQVCVVAFLVIKRRQLLRAESIF